MYGHNEDGGFDDRSRMFLQRTRYDCLFVVVNAHSTGAASWGLQSFTFFTYPAALAGNAFGINDLGVTISSNALFPRNVDLSVGVLCCIALTLLRRRPARFSQPRRNQCHRCI